MRSTTKPPTPMQRYDWIRARRVLAGQINEAWEKRCASLGVPTFGGKLVSPEGLSYSLWLLLVQKQPNLEALKAFESMHDHIADMARLWAAEPKLLSRLAIEFGERMATDRIKVLEEHWQEVMPKGVAG
jgi:hypothetical protein